MQHTNVIRSARSLAAALLLLWGCGDATAPSVPTTLVLSLTSVSLDAVGATQSVTASVKDQHGQAMPDAPVTWRSSAPAATVTPSTSAATPQSATIAAAAAGPAVVTAAAGGVSSTVAVIVSQVPATLARISGDAQSGTVNAALAAPLVVRVLDRLGAPIAGQAVAFSVTSGGGAVASATVPTSADGSAAGIWTLGTIAAETQQLAATVGTLPAATFTATARAGAPAAVAVVTGNAQSAVVGSPVAVAPTVRVADAFDNPVSGVTVTFSASSDGTVSAASAATSAAGTASPGAWTLGTRPGANSLTITAGALAPISIAATAGVGAPASIVAVSGTGQTATVGTALAQLPTVRVSDRFGNGVPGVVVGFSVAAGGGTIGAATATTGEQGTAAAGVWTLGRAPGTNTIGITVPGVAAVTMDATAVAGAPESVVVTAGDAQSGAAGSVLPVAPSVRVSDRYGNPLAGIVVVFTASGGGKVAASSSTTSADGAATPGAWTLGTAVGTNTLTGAVAGVPPVTLTASVTAGPAAGLVIVAGDNQTAPAGTPVAVPPSVKVRDAYGNAVRGAQVSFTPSAGGGSVSGGAQTSGADGIATVSGWTLGATAGANTLSAQTSGAPPVTFTATGTVVASVGTIAALAGGNVAAMAGQPVTVRPAVVVRTLAGAPLAGVIVTFAVTSGGGAITGATAATDASGTATVGSWTLGGVANGNTLTASVTAPGIGGGPIVFSASGCEGGGGAGFAITVCYRDTMTSSQRAAFATAAAKWSTVIVGDEPDVAANVAMGTCGAGSPAVNLTIDDVLIFASITPIDGAGKVLGQAGPCYTRTAGGLPVVGLMLFDAADVANMEANATLTPVILHEMGHVLGVGTMWGTDLLKNPSTAATTLDTYFAGAGATAAFNTVGGAAYTGGMKVPVENTGGGGTMNAHWRESVLANELMTGYINGGTNPLSVVTVRSLEDIGYLVNTGAADQYFRTLSLRAPGDTPAAVMESDVLTVPRHTIDPDGRVHPGP